MRKDEGTGGKLCVVLLAISLVLFTMSCRESGSGPLTAARSAFTTVTSPVRYLGYAVTTPFRSLGNVLHNITADEQTLSDLEAANAELEARNAELEEYELTAERLQDLLDLKSSYNLQSTGARIISSSSDSWTSTVVIDKGTSSGLAVGMPVTGPGGVIGQIMEVSATTATVRLITDESSSVSAMVQSSRAQGMLEGSADGTLHLTLIKTDQEVEVDDIIVTSGLGGVFPKGLPLGRVTSVDKADGALYYTITVEPFSTAESYEEVLVITALNEDQQATADDIAEADEQEETITSDDDSSSTDDEDADDTESDDDTDATAGTDEADGAE